MKATNNLIDRMDSYTFSKTFTRAIRSYVRSLKGAYADQMSDVTLTEVLRGLCDIYFTGLEDTPFKLLQLRPYENDTAYALKQVAWCVFHGFLSRRNKRVRFADGSRWAVAQEHKEGFAKHMMKKMLPRK